MFSHYPATDVPGGSCGRSAWVFSFIAHGLTALLAVWVTAIPRSTPTPAAARRLIYEFVSATTTPDPPGGGGGGGDETPDAATARMRGDDRHTVPPPPGASSQLAEEPPAAQTILLPVVPMAAGLDVSPGLIQPAALSGATQGPGRRGGAGDGVGPGSGEGEGDGGGPGRDRGVGDGPFREGSGVSRPQVVREVKPNYTAAAMRAKMQGVVLVECVVLPDGTVGNARIVKSLDRVFGLDEEALKAARQWRFIPAKRRGESVPVVITIEVAFTLR
jgi:protein TonB